MLDQVAKKLSKYYWENKQHINFQSHYEDIFNSVDTECCVIDPRKNRCILCTRIQTFSNLDLWKLGNQPYYIYDPDYNEVTITIQRFGNLTQEDVANALYYITKQFKGVSYLFFNIQLDGENYNKYVTKSYPIYCFDPESLRRIQEANKKEK